jgi:hypothetical protein
VFLPFVLGVYQQELKRDGETRGLPVQSREWKHVFQNVEKLCRRDDAPPKKLVGIGGEPSGNCPA